MVQQHVLCILHLQYFMSLQVSVIFYSIKTTSNKLLGMPIVFLPQRSTSQTLKPSIGHYHQARQERNVSLLWQKKSKMIISGSCNLKNQLDLLVLCEAYINLLNVDPSVTLDEFYNIALMKHMDLYHPDNELSMKQSKDINWHCLLLICFKNADKALKGLGN